MFKSLSEAKAASHQSNLKAGAFKAADEKRERQQRETYSKNLQEIM